ncbi:hypothetical protein V9L05_03010 [Bernardetia sp. Wsw4-3y2]|uniref:hypothetical protein n=1 Tax=Bernardetia sp. Wsw4-3y2 TaxID=3127471 RepID=UPI0030D13993
MFTNFCFELASANSFVFLILLIFLALITALPFFTTFPRALAPFQISFPAPPTIPTIGIAATNDINPAPAVARKIAVAWLCRVTYMYSACSRGF